MTCPACGRPDKGVVLVCSACWWEVPATDRQKLGRMYRANPRNPAAYETKLAQVVRNLKSKHAAEAARAEDANRVVAGNR